MPTINSDDIPAISTENRSVRSVTPDQNEAAQALLIEPPQLQPWREKADLQFDNAVHIFQVEVRPVKKFQKS